jgi:hypothetical protein
MGRVVMFGSVTLPAELPPWPFSYEPIPRGEWAAGDYVVAEVLPHPGQVEGFELRNGREAVPMPGDLLVGAFARRFATLEAAGSFEHIGEDGLMHSMSEAGCFGLVTSRSRFSRGLMPLGYRGHVLVDGAKTNMREHVPPASDADFRLPVVLVVGTSMSAGKTFSACVAVRQLKELGLRVVASKLTGAGRRHDVLTMGDAGADHVFDFIDAGLPTTVCRPEVFRDAIGGLLSRMAGTNAEVAVVEAGASPLEPYNGGTLVELLADRVVFTILCASDPYALVGIQQAWGRSFDLVAGPAANTEAGVALVRRLAELPAMDLMSPENYPVLRGRLREALSLEEPE